MVSEESFVNTDTSTKSTEANNMNENKRFKLTTNQKNLRSRMGISLWFLAFMLLATACSVGLKTTADPVSTRDDAIQIPDEAQSYLEKIRQSLVEDLAISPEQVELESITAPATLAEPYIIKVVVKEIRYEFHGLDREIQLISISEPEPQIIDE